MADIAMVIIKVCYCYQTSQEESLWCVVVHLGFEIVKNAVIAMVTMQVIFLSDCNETSQEWSFGYVVVQSGF